MISGSSANGLGPIPNAAGDGVLVNGSASGAIIDNDQISGVAVGVELAGSGNFLQGDVIGSTNPITRAGNSIGIEIDSGSVGNVIGIDAGTSAQDAYAQSQILGNTIANNTASGIEDNSAGPNTIRGNAISQNGPAINSTDPNSIFVPYGIVRTVASSTPTVELAGAVLITNATTPLTIEGSLGSVTSSQAYRIDLYTQAVLNPTQTDGTPTPIGELTPEPQGQVYLGSFDFTPSTSVVFTYTGLPTSLLSLVQAGQFLTATATPIPPSTAPATVEDTSPFSEPIFVSSGLEVINNNPTGPGSLFGALQVAASLGPKATSSIVFRLPAGQSTIALSSANPLPVIINNVLIDGYTQAGAAQGTVSSPPIFVVTIDGSNLSSGSAHGLTIGAGGSATIRGLRFIDFQTNVPAIEVMGGTGSKISGDAFGYKDGSSTALNAGAGVKVDSSLSSVSSLVIGGTTAADRNFFAGNATGVEVDGPNTSSIAIEGNNFGLEGNGLTTAANGTGILVNGASGVSILDNTIEASTGPGIQLKGNLSPTAPGDTSSVNINGNTIGAIGHGNGQGIFLDGASARNPIVIQNNSIVSSIADGVDLTGSNNIQLNSNFIGVNATGSLGVGGGFANSGDGLLITGSTNVTVTLDVIANNKGNGISAVGAIGATVSGGSITGNGGDGIAVSGNAMNTQINGVVISSSGLNGISVVGSTGTSISVPSITGVGGNGITIGPLSVGTKLSGGTITGSAGDGVSVVGGTSATLSAP